MFDVDRRNPEQLARAFAIASGDDGCVNVNETALLKKLMYRECEAAAYTEHTTEKIRAWTQMRDVAQKFWRVPLFLERITFVGATDDFDISRNEFPFLSFALRWDQRTLNNK